MRNHLIYPYLYPLIQKTMIQPNLLSQWEVIKLDHTQILFLHQTLLTAVLGEKVLVGIPIGIRTTFMVMSLRLLSTSARILKGISVPK